MSSIGASGTNAYTSYDVTCYVENIPSNQIDLWARIQADRFENCVLRGFHTELETIYEEYNMYAAMDQQKMFGAMFEGLFENHPYNTDVIGLPEHLKNPSITNVKKYHDQWYVPNNMAIVLSGDFDPDKAVSIIDKYFGGMKPNDALERPVFESEKPIEAPIVKEVRGNESPSLLLAWRLPAAKDPEMLKASLLSEILYNGAAGLVDLDVNQQQKTLSMMAGLETLADYSALLVIAEPKAGQSLEEVKSIFMEELEKVKAGDFDEALMESIVSNMKLHFMRQMESTGTMARMAVNNFVNDESWEDDVVNYIDRLSALTKEDIVRFASEYIADNYVQVNKLQAKDPRNVSIDKPQISPIFTNRDTSSLFLREVQRQASEVKPIEPVFVDYKKDMSILSAKSGLPVLYKKNVTNGTFELDYMFETGSYADKMLPLAFSYADYLGTGTMTPEEVKAAFYNLACSVALTCSGEKSYISLSGLAENMAPAMELLESIVSDARANPDALRMLKMNILQERENAKHDKRVNFSRLRSYGLYGPENPATNILSSEELMAVTDEQLLEKIHSFFNFEHKVLYYGPLSGKEIVQAINAAHNIPDALTPVVEGDPFQYRQVTGNEVIIAPYDDNQAQIYSIADWGEKFDIATVPYARMYNEYFGGGMNSIVFQEMREARGLCYTAGASYVLPSDLKHDITYIDIIYTQNDKVIDALDAFDEIINNMPVSDNAFGIAREGILANIRTSRTIKSRVLWSYIAAQKLGLEEDLNKVIYEKAGAITLDDVVRFQQENVKGRNLKIMILGRESELDDKALSRFGTVRHVTTEDIFGY